MSNPQGHRDIVPHPTDPSTPLKRPHPSRQTQGYPRKRSMKACKTCRLRKTKCNNERPVCGFCQSLGAVCDYEDGNDLSILDSASQIIVQKLEELSSKVDESMRISRRDFDELRSRTTSSTPRAVETQFRTPSSIAVTERTPIPPVDVHSKELERKAENELFTPAFRIAPDSILEWPILKKHHEYGETPISDCVFEQEFIDASPFSNEDSQSSMAVGTIDEEAMPRLVSSFFSNVHVHDPVLDNKLVERYVAEVATNGFGWSASSCLVLIMCALGAFSHPFESRTSKGGIKSSDGNPEGVAQSQPYYKAACKRVGFLKSDLISIQCFFLLGKYEETMFQPLAAWKWFAAASNSLLVYLKSRAAYERQNPAFKQSENLERVEASLYWSCHKALCDLRTELPLPTSTIAEVDYAHVLPPPPSNIDAHLGFEPQSSTIFGAYNGRLPQLPADHASLRSNSSSVLSSVTMQMSEDIWLYYMSDIITSRLKNRILRTLYDKDHTSWNPENLFHILQSMNEFECKFDNWYQQLPRTLKFKDTSHIQTTHLHFLVQFKALELRMALYTPFLYYILHHSSSFPPPAFITPPPSQNTFLRLSHLSSEEVEDQILVFAHKAVINARVMIHVGEDMDMVKTRRWPGSWRLARLVLTSALIIVAVGAAIVDGGVDGLRGVEGCNEDLTLAKKRLMAWSEEGMTGGQDLRIGVEIIDRLLCSPRA